MKLGAHVPLSGGLPGAADSAGLVGCEVMQVFTSNPRGWQFTVRSDDEVSKFKNHQRKNKIEAVFGHSIYLINIASSNPYIYTNSINSLISGLTLAHRAGFAGVVTHIGSHTGKGYQAGLRQVLNALEQILSTTEGKVPILLETDAGSGNHLGCKFTDIGEIVNNIKSDAIKVCLDTCHSFVSGYPLHTKEGLEETLTKFDKEVGLDRLALLHLNDSKGALGSNLDRHEVIGEGELGLEAFERIVNHPKLKHLPGVVETPDNNTLADENISLNRLRKLRK